MKLIFAIVNSDDAADVTRALTKNGFSSTSLATNGGFLMRKNVTLLIGVDDEKVSTVLDIVKELSHSRKQIIPATIGMGHDFPMGLPADVKETTDAKSKKYAITLPSEGVYRVGYRTRVI